MKTRLLVLFAMVSTGIFAQNFWSTTQLQQKELKTGKATVSGEKLYALDVNALMQHLRNAPSRSENLVSSTVIVEFPNMDGNFERFYVVEASNFEPGLQERFPDIRAYRGYGINNPNLRISFSVSPTGIMTMKRSLGQPTEFIEPLSTDNTIYQVHGKSAKDSNWVCSTEEHSAEDLDHNFMESPETLDTDDSTLRTLRIAVSTTGEYTTYHGGTVAGALAGINATMTRLNTLYENDLAVHLSLIANNDQVIYTNAATDPYSTNGAGWNTAVQNTLTSVIGEANYDIGHLFANTVGGGNAGCIGCICTNGTKGRGWSASYAFMPEGDRYDIDYVAHEIGHQFGGNHTFSRWEGSQVNYEPGSGSTIMGYAGITYPATNVQANSDDYFHVGSITQISANLLTKTCPTTTTLTNQPPVVDAGADYTIPAGTPFILNGTGSDPDGDPVTFTWEQVDSSPSSIDDFSVAQPNLFFGPLNRSVYPTTDGNERYIPSFDKVVAGTLNTSFESVANITRSMNFALTARDNNASGVGQTKTDRMRVSVNANNGPFVVTGPLPNTTVRTGTPVTVSWDVVGTNEAPFNSPNVDIYFSDDNAENFVLLASQVANTGTADVTIPAGVQSTEAFFLVKSHESIFYALGPKITVGYQITSVCTDYAATNLPLAIADGTSTGGNGAWSFALFSLNGEAENIQEVRVSVDIAHTNIGDLQVMVQSSSPARQAFVWQNGCEGSSGLQATFVDYAPVADCASPTVGEIAPYAPLTAFEGANNTGTWRVGVRDQVNTNTGTFNAANLTVCSIELSDLGTQDIAGSDANLLNVYPNPSTGVFNIKTELNTTGVNLQVFDVTGKLIKSHKDSNANGNFDYQLNLSGVAKGTYILQLQNGSQVTSKKLIVK